MQKITPFLWFENQAEEAANFYCNIFKNSKVTGVSPMIVTFELEGMKFTALNGGPRYKFTEAISFVVTCESQEEVDYYWNKLTSDGGQESMCAWLKDKYGLSWQIVPTALIELIGDPNRDKANRAMQALLKMKKIVIADLVKAFDGK
ncbi:MAG TPA: VOC family protein [Bacteroidia bacterium]|nr:VOC family protein [Bacteroidia bacterium]